MEQELNFVTERTNVAHFFHDQIQTKVWGSQRCFLSLSNSFTNNNTSFPLLGKFRIKIFFRIRTDSWPWPSPFFDPFAEQP
jgi:hypothetical protein